MQIMGTQNSARGQRHRRNRETDVQKSVGLLSGCRADRHGRLRDAQMLRQKTLGPVRRPMGSPHTDYGSLQQDGQNAGARLTLRPAGGERGESD